MGARHRRRAGDGMEGEMSSTWTEERTALLTKLWKEGRSAAVVAAEMGITKNMVIGKVTRLGISGRGYPTVIAKPPPQRRPPTIPPRAEAAHPLRSVPYLDRTAAQCAWILTADIRGMPMEAVRVCGALVERRDDGALRSYCRRHRIIGTAMRGLG